MKIEIGKTYKVEPTFKKSVIEIMSYYNDDGSIDVETCWRWGTFNITPENENEVSRLQEGIDTTDDYINFCVSNFKNWDFIDCWDDCGTSLQYDIDWDDDKIQQFEEEYWDDPSEMLEKHNFHSSTCEFYIQTNLNVEEITE